MASGCKFLSSLLENCYRKVGGMSTYHIAPKTNTYYQQVRFRPEGLCTPRALPTVLDVDLFLIFGCVDRM